MKSGLLDEILKLTPDERIELMDDIWRSIQLDDTAPTEEELKELRVRAQRLEADPSRGTTWEDVKDRMKREPLAH